MSKYRAIPTEVNGIRFASKKEASVYMELMLAERSGEISRLELQPRYDITINGIYCGHYKADFRFFSKKGVEVWDVKGFRTPVFKLKKRIVEALYPGVVIKEV